MQGQAATQYGEYCEQSLNYLQAATKFSGRQQPTSDKKIIHA